MRSIVEVIVRMKNPPRMNSSSYWKRLFLSVDQWSLDVCGIVPSHIYPKRSQKSTFTFNMVSLEWTHAGEWLLLFKCRADFVGVWFYGLNFSPCHIGCLNTNLEY